jgi:alkylation response protein AidB-like acyl-CoA dehydrogenase
MSSELKELQESAQKVLGEVGLAADEGTLWPLVVELGWLLVALPDDLGGLAQGLPGACAMYVEQGRSLGTAPYIPAMLSISAIAHGRLADRDTWLERLTAGGELVTTPLADSALRIAAESSGKVKVSGQATALLSADKASHVLVCSGDADCVALLPLRQPGIDLVARPTWDATRRLFDLRAAEAEVDDALVLARGDAAKALAARIAVERDFALAADSVGGAAALLNLTVEYLQTRRQFGRPLALFQALKHRCADLKVQTEAAEALLLDNLKRLGEASAAEAGALGKAAKSLACSAFARVAEEALQLHGGIGMTSEHPCHLFLKRALLNENLGGARGSYELDLADGFLGRTAWAAP